jgi:hypothetical protein
MPPLVIAQLIIALGPSAFSLIESLIAVWSKPTLTVDEVLAITKVARTSYDEYIAKAQAQAT